MPHLAVAVLVGQVGGSYGAAPSLWWLVALAALPLWIWQRAGQQALAQTVYAALLAAASICGAAQARAALIPDCHPGTLCGLPLPGLIRVEGWLTAEPSPAANGRRLDLRVAAVERGGKWESVRGMARVSARAIDADWHAGECVRARIWLRRPRNFGNPGAFDYEGHLRRQEIFVTGNIYASESIARCSRPPDGTTRRVYEARRRIGAAIDAALPPDPAGVVRALLIGDRSRISRVRQARYGRAGTGHLLAISGLHLAVVATAVFGCLRFLLGQSESLRIRGWSSRIAAVGALAPAIGYALLAGGRSPTLRAALMLLVFLGAVAAGRRSRVSHGLALAAILMAVARPGIVFDPGFVFSFAAVLSILLGLARLATARAQPVRRISGRSEATGHGSMACFRSSLGTVRRWILTSIVVSSCAGLGTAPLSAYYFNTVSIVGPVTNLFVLPLYGGAVVIALLGAALTLAGVDGAFAFVVAGRAIGLGEAVIWRAAGFPAAAIHVFTPTGMELVLAYALLACAFVRRRRRWIIGVVLAALLVDTAYWTRERYARPELRVTFLDVGQGDAVIVEFPGSAVLVVDAGGFPGSGFDPGEAIVARFLRSRKIGRVDFVAMSHADADHAGGLGFLISTFRPREFWWNGRRGQGSVLARVQAALLREHVAIHTLSRGSPSRRIGPVAVRVLHPGGRGGAALSANDASLVLRLEWGETSVLLPGDLEREGERRLVRRSDGDLASTVLKVPHHGSRSSSTPSFLDAVRPAVAVISLGFRNRYRFPHAEVERRYRARGVCLLRTDEDGAIVFRATAAAYKITPSCPTLVKASVKQSKYVPSGDTPAWDGVPRPP